MHPYEQSPCGPKSRGMPRSVLITAPDSTENRLTSHFRATCATPDQAWLFSEVEALGYCKHLGPRMQWLAHEDEPRLSPRLFRHSALGFLRLREDRTHMGCSCVPALSARLGICFAARVSGIDSVGADRRVADQGWGTAYQVSIPETGSTGTTAGCCGNLWDQPEKK